MEKQTKKHFKKRNRICFGEGAETWNGFAVLHMFDAVMVFMSAVRCCLKIL